MPGKSDKHTFKELENLNIHVFDLLFGITLGVENPVKNRYYGRIGRLGRAIGTFYATNAFYD